tara:strand:- start:5821 stop:6399 length:579 start_codon:yes stop_codon:yes gene_type:complete
MHPDNELSVISNNKVFTIFDLKELLVRINYPTPLTNTPMNHMLLITAQRCGLNDSSKVAQLVRAAKTSNRSVIDMFLESGELNEKSFLYQLSQNLMMHWWEPEIGWNWSSELASVISKENAEEWQIVPFKTEEFRNPASREIHIASYQPVDEDAIIQHLNQRQTSRVIFYLTTRDVVSSGLEAIYEPVGLPA